jgi:hypothetical protein
MKEIRTVSTLAAKREEIERSIANYEARLEQARVDLSHVNAVYLCGASTAPADCDRRTTIDVALDPEHRTKSLAAACGLAKLGTQTAIRPKTANTSRLHVRVAKLSRIAIVGDEAYLVVCGELSSRNH